MTDYIVRADCNQLLYSCHKCGKRGSISVPYPVVQCPCPHCDAHILIEAVVITTRTLAIKPIIQRVRDWLTWHTQYNISQMLWANMLAMPYKRQEP